MERTVECLNLKFIGDAPLTAELLQGDQKSSGARPESFVSTPLDYIVNKTKQILSQPCADSTTSPKVDGLSEQEKKWREEEKTFKDSEEYKSIKSKDTHILHLLLLGDESSGKSEFFEKFIAPKISYQVPNTSFSLANIGKKGVPSFNRSVPKSGMNFSMVRETERNADYVIAVCDLLPPFVNDITSTFWKLCDGAIVFIDVCSPDAINQVQKYIRMLTKAMRSDISVNVFGMNADKPHQLTAESLEKGVLSDLDYDVMLKFEEINISQFKKVDKLFKEIMGSLIKQKFSHGDEKENCTVF